MPISLIVLVIVTLILVLMYNSLVSKKNQVENIFASVDTTLKKRYDLIPNLVASVSKYMEHEKSLLEEVTKLRADANKPNISDAQKIQLDAKVSSALGSIMIAVENYPDLKANENVMHLQHSLTEIEEQISAARRAYNQAVTDYNNAIEMIPTNFMASAMNYTRKEVFVIVESERKNVNVKELFN
ncbi:MAG: LemA family protein [Epsilonproteobacteria bacterium]|nr:LemA family protein [Campylobacterota bacterium]OIO17656.1 MAG: LemA family protein [Helicobacteraceae bacterium CG1_02_36_14]PIP09648.1 MAG: LemA family protein [Sulfurimonas sp. CG23_combo_of_CG06-09_8_20_14_all_36_33]PIS26193.1 MAG: LemA family protein [Sulfurimonas sp. CG08_land_8_20_14_0_20_36_33]PIU34277.1 MAG: LemA family protein [Sulfurimonas sp. CG07_land_8_20_14_0_80_36_56]PIV02575.1 MAG: LemA family protein [Sulfurimonas sp. CG03_land_8_20_14_0_80_36_25]PIV34672.1 MAG: LemA fami